jgi:Mg2+/Co2+ transporter CorC
VPTVGEHVQVKSVDFCVMAMDHLRIERLEITLPDTAQDTPLAVEK